MAELNTLVLEVYLEDLDDYIVAEVEFMFQPGYTGITHPLEYAEPDQDDEYEIQRVAVLGETIFFTEYEEQRIINQLIKYRKSNF